MDFSGPDNYLNEAADRIEQLETLESSALGSLGNALRERDELRRRAVDAEQENAAAWEENYELRALLAEIKKHVTLCRAGKVRNDDAAAAAYDLLARIDAALNGGRK